MNKPTAMFSKLDALFKSTLVSIWALGNERWAPGRELEV